MHARCPKDPGATPHARCAACGALRHGPARNAVFERLLARFRDDLLVALQREPDGPARHLRAYVRSIQAHAVRPARPGRGALLLARPPYRMIWSEFAEESCASDALDPAQSAAVRRAAEALWYQHARASFSSTTIHATAAFDALGALLHALGASREPPMTETTAPHHEPHRAA